MTIFATNGARVFIGGRISIPGRDLTESDYSGQTWTEIGETESLGTFGDTSAEIAFDAINSQRTRRRKGARTAGNLELMCGIDYTDAGQLALLAAEKSIYDYAFKILLNDGPPGNTSTVTISVASPGVVTWAAHGLVAGTPVVFSTTGALPTGLTAGATYYVSATGLTSGAFSVALTPGGTAIVTTGTQSGVHTAVATPTGSQRLFGALVASAAEALDSANNIMKLNSQLWINSNIVRIALSA
jgi:hypothetical protein